MKSLGIWVSLKSRVHWISYFLKIFLWKCISMPNHTCIPIHFHTQHTHRTCTWKQGPDQKSPPPHALSQLLLHRWEPIPWFSLPLFNNCFGGHIRNYKLYYGDPLIGYKDDFHLLATTKNPAKNTHGRASLCKWASTTWKWVQEVGFQGQSIRTLWSSYYDGFCKGFTKSHFQFQHVKGLFFVFLSAHNVLSGWEIIQ